MGGPLKDKNTSEGKKVKEVCTYADVVSPRRSTDGHSNGEEKSKFRDFERNHYFKDNPDP